MEAGAAILSSISSFSLLNFNASSSYLGSSIFRSLPILLRNSRASFSYTRHSINKVACNAVVTVDNSTESVSFSSSSSSSESSISKVMLPKVDKTGKFSSPRAAREFALLVLYAACLEGSDPVRLFEKRLNFRREPGYQFDKKLLLNYNHMTFSGPPVSTNTIEEAKKILRSYEKESEIEAAVLSAPPKLVYNKGVLRFTKKLLVSIMEKWDIHALVIEKIVPPDWKNAAGSRILELCILHMAMSEITEIGTRYQIVINEAVDLGKRFCKGDASRIINGCLRTFVKDFEDKPVK